MYIGIGGVCVNFSPSPKGSEVIGNSRSVMEEVEHPRFWPTGQAIVSRREVQRSWPPTNWGMCNIFTCSVFGVDFFIYIES